ncbi:MAG TPA: hypothetical protein VEQ42_05395, partial [Pyrinomonadaceae bacterium]|nr:hypothetical protein [Pyrinomonadaceae bacterium]
MRLVRTHLRLTLLFTLVLSSAAGLLVAPFVSGRRQATTPPASHAGEMPSAQARENYGRIPLSFESNHGQTDGSVNFLARGAGYTLFLKPAEAVFALRNAGCGRRGEEPAERLSQAETRAQTSDCDLPAKVLRMRLEGADASAEAVAADELAGKVNYFKGNDPAKWRANVPTFGRVRYREIYPGVDVVYYGNQRQLEYDFVVAPGRDARAVSLKFEGADKVEVDGGGDLLLTVDGEVVRQLKPVIYQEAAGSARSMVEGSYALKPNGQVGFELGEYDTERPLVIDPVIVYSTYLGGNDTDLARAIAVDPSGEAC